MPKKLLRACVQVAGEKVWLSAHTKKELEEKKVQARSHLRDGISAQKDETFYDLVLAWWKNQKKPHITNPNTAYVYQTVIYTHLLPHINKAQLIKAVTRTDLQEILNTQEGEAQTTINLCLSVMKNVFSLAIADKRITTDPTYNLVKPKAKPKTTKGALTDQQVRKTLETAKNAGKNGLFIYILYYLGLRKNEMLGLMWSDFDFESGMVHIQRSLQQRAEKPYLSTLKTEASNRLIPIPAQLAEILKPYRNSNEMYLFAENGEFMTWSKFDTIWRSLMIKSGLSHYSKSKTGNSVYQNEVTPHWFRHNYITMLYDAGVPAEIAMRLAGHSSYNITIGIYTHIKQQRIKQEALKLDHVFSKTFAQPLQLQQKSE